MGSGSELWAVLRTVKRLRFEARCLRPPEWNGVGEGEVSVGEQVSVDPSPAGESSSAEGSLLFHENGRWTLPDGRRLPFSNVFRWTRLPPAGAHAEPRLRLEHLRFGPERPVFLFDLVPEISVPPVRSDPGRHWVSREPHRCGDDLYSGDLRWSNDWLELEWRLRGPRKQGCIRYLYRP